MFKYKIQLLLLSLPFLFFNCSDDNHNIVIPEPGNPNGKNSVYVYSYWTTDYHQYIWQTSSLDYFMEGTINMKGIGIEQAGNMIPVGNKFLGSSTGIEGGRSYYIDVNGKLATGGREDRIYLETAYAYGTTHDEKAIIVGASWNGATSDSEVLLYDPKQVAYTNRKFHDFGMEHNGTKLIQFPTAIMASGDYVYMSYFPRPMGNQWGSPIQDTAYIKILKYPSLEYVKDIKQPKGALIGMYYANSGLVRTDKGDIYTFSSNAYSAGYTEDINPSCILRIKKGETEFDKDYYIDFENGKLQGKILAAYHAGGEKAVVAYIPKEKDTAERNFAFLGSESLFKSAVIDLETQEITPITGLGDHTGDAFYGFASLYAEDGKAYKSYIVGSEPRVYQIDLETGKAKAGALIEGGFQLPVIAKLKY